MNYRTILRGPLGFASIAAAMLWAACQTNTDGSDPSTVGPSITDDRVQAEVVEGLERGEPQEVLVTFQDVSLSSIAMATLGHEPQTLEEFARVIEARRDALAAFRQSYVKPIVLGDVEPSRTYDNLPIFAATLDSLDELEVVLEQTDTVFIERVGSYALMDVESNALIRQPATAIAGRTGAGTTVAVLDTGANFAHADLGSCSAPNTGATCRVVYAQDFAPNDGARDDNGHGTNVSAVVLAVAPDAKVAALDIFSGGGASSTVIVAAVDWVIANRATYNIVSMNMSFGGGAFTSPCTTGALTVAIDNARSAGVLSVAASGNNGFTNAMASPACSANAISVGAVYDANVGGLGYSVCNDYSTDADRVTCFSNSASFLTLLAPGAMVDGGGYSMAGTSQASPHVAGAVAVLRAAYPLESLAQIVTRMTSTGVPVTDPRQRRVTPRLNLLEASADTCAIGVSSATIVAQSTGATTSLSLSTGASCPWAASSDSAWIRLSASSGMGNATLNVTIDASPDGSARTGRISIGSNTVTVSQGADTQAPSGASIVINGGAATAASRDVTLTLSATDDVGVTQMCISNSSTCSSWIAYATSSAWTLTEGNGDKTVYAQFRDARGNVSSSTSDTITLDLPAPPRTDTPPSMATISIDGGAATTRSAVVTLTLMAVDDSAVTGMCISDTTTCSAWLPYGTTSSWTLPTAAGSGLRTVYAFFRDDAGQVTATPASASILYDTTSPTDVALSVAAGDAVNELSWTAGSDAHSGVAGYKIVFGTGSAPGDCSSGTTLATTGSSTLSYSHRSLTNGTTYGYRICTVDAAGNVSAGSTASGMPRAVSIAPVGAPLVIEGGAAFTNRTRVRLSLSATDPDGVTHMSIRAVRRCTTTSCTPPTRGTWIAYATSSEVEFSRQGEYTIYVWFRDALGNETTTLNSANIAVDLTKPVIGRLSASGRTGSVVLTWSGFSDAMSGLARYTVVMQPRTAPRDCATGTPVYSGTDTTATVTGLTAGTSYGFAVCATDNVGNLSLPARAVDRAR